MEGITKDSGSLATGTRRYRIPLRNSLRNRLGERHLIPVASGLFAVPFFGHHFLYRIGREISAALATPFRSIIMIYCASLALICLADRVHAVPICDRNYNAAWCSVESSRAGRDLHGFYSVGLPYPDSAYGNFNEGDNIEWIYDALENQYAFLDDTLYRIMGGNYLLGSVCYPHWHGFQDYYYLEGPARGIIYAEDQRAGSFAVNMEQTESGDLISFAARQGTTGQGHSLAPLHNISGWPHNREIIDVDVKVIPEPSTIVLFGLVALQILRFKRISRN